MWRYLALILVFFTGLSSLHAQESPTPAGKMVVMKTAYHTTFRVYMAGPDEAQYGALLVHDRWGLNEHVMRWADKVAALGYRVIAIDFFDGRTVKNNTMAREVIKSIDPVWVEADLRAAVATLAGPNRKIVGVTWGKGAHYTASLARQMPGAFSALITYQRRSTAGLGAARRLNLPLLEVVSERSLLNPADHEGSAKVREDSWEATVKFLDTNFERAANQVISSK